GVVDLTEAPPVDGVLAGMDRPRHSGPGFEADRGERRCDEFPLRAAPAPLDLLIDGAVGCYRYIREALPLRRIVGRLERRDERRHDDGSEREEARSEEQHQEVGGLHSSAAFLRTSTGFVSSGFDSGTGCFWPHVARRAFSRSSSSRTTASLCVTNLCRAVAWSASMTPTSAR